MGRILQTIGLTVLKLPFLVVAMVFWAALGLLLVILYRSVCDSADRAMLQDPSIEAHEEALWGWPGGFVNIWNAFFGPGSRELDERMREIERAG